MKKILKKIGSFLFNYLSIGIFLVIWEIVPRSGLIKTSFFPSFSNVIIGLVGLFERGEMGKHLTISLERALVGFILGLLFAIPLGILIGWFKKFEKFINPLIEAFRNLSVLSILPVFVLIFGIGEVSRIAVIFWGVLWSVLLNTIGGVKGVDPLLIKGARSMGISNRELFIKVVFPGALPSIFTGIKLSATTSILVLIAAEMIGASSGLGYAINFYQANFKIPEMYATILVLAILGISINYICNLIEKRVFKWKETIKFN
jgi:NitT/TauT family transport system permease protein